MHVSSDFNAAFDPDARAALLGDKAHCAVFDNSKIKSLVPGFVCTVPFAEGIRRSVEWFDAKAERQTVDETFEARMDRIIEAHESALASAARTVQ